MNSCKEINEYIGLVNAGVVILSKDNHLLIKNIVKPLLADDTVTFDSEMYYTYLKYAEKYYYSMLPFQKFLAAFHFTYYPDGSLCFTEYFYLMGRGNGKDGFIAPLINFFQTPLFGIYKYHIDIVATSEDQAEGTFELVYDMIKEGDYKVQLKKHFYANKEKVVHRKTLSRLQFNTSNSKTKDGKRPGCIVLNEVHAYEDFKNINVHTSGLGKVDRGRTIIISTNGDVRGGPLDNYISQAEMKLNGELPTIRLFPFLCRMDSEEEVFQPELYEKANPAINHFPVLQRTILEQLEKINKKIADSSTIVEFYTKRMNLPKQDETKCVATWENILASNEPVRELYGYSAIAGIDYAEIQDFAAAGLLVEYEGKSDWITHSWYCKNSPSRNLIKFPIDESAKNGELTLVDAPAIDPEEVVKWIVGQAQFYNILAIVCDRYRYNLLKEVFDKYGIVPKTKDNPNGLLVLVGNGTFTHSKLAPVIENKFLHHQYRWGKNRLMNWYVNNTGVKTDDKGNKSYFKIDKETRKNDGFMALVHAESEAYRLAEANVDIQVYDVIL